MNPTVIYIGRNKELIARFSAILDKTVAGMRAVFYTHVEALNWLSIHPEARNAIILYESQQTGVNVVEIRTLRHHFPYLYILLITPDLTPQERIKYIRCGVNDTFPTDIEEAAVREFFDFIVKYQPQLEKNSKLKKTTVVLYKIPLTKRLFDITTSLLAMIVLSPLFLLVALAIRVESKGPIIYKSKRVGSNYLIFEFLKFRSMYVDADKHLKEMKAHNQYQADSVENEAVSQSMANIDNTLLVSDDSIGGLTEKDGQVLLVDDDSIVPENEYISKSKDVKENAFVKIEKDPRITKVGHFIRKYSLDELPQLINILKGDMSVVGNRPLPLYEAELLTQDQSVERFTAPAGLTGLWQVEKRGDSGKMSSEERKQLDIYYARHYSVWLDLKIIFRTFTAFIQKEDV